MCRNIVYDYGHTCQEVWGQGRSRPAPSAPQRRGALEEQVCETEAFCTESAAERQGLWRKLQSTIF